jgi:hypothetical protein
MNRSIITCEHCCQPCVLHREGDVVRIFAPCGCHRGGVVNEEV